jgi:hypothetical protein
MAALKFAALSAGLPLIIVVVLRDAKTPSGPAISSASLKAKIKLLFLPFGINSAIFTSFP